MVFVYYRKNHAEYPMEDRILADNRSTRPTQQNENGAMPLKPDGTPYTIEEIRQIQAYRKAMAAKRRKVAPALLPIHRQRAIRKPHVRRRIRTSRRTANRPDRDRHDRSPVSRRSRIAVGSRTSPIPQYCSLSSSPLQSPSLESRKS